MYKKDSTPAAAKYATIRKYACLRQTGAQRFFHLLFNPSLTRLHVQAGYFLFPL